MHIERKRIVCIWFAILFFHFFSKGQEQNPFLEDFEQQARQIEKAAGGTLGISALHIESGEKFSYKGNERYPMASVYKFPIAIQLLHQVDQNKIRLEQKLTVKQQDLRPGHSPLAARMLKEGQLTISVRDLLELMVSQSDNTACDVLLNIIGGGEAVNARLKEFGITDIQVSRPESKLMLDFCGVTQPPETDTWTLQRVNQLIDAVPAPKRTEALHQFLNDPQDTSTPDAMVHLLELTHKQKMLKSATNQLLLELMIHTPTGAARLKGGLPPGTVLAHKTGTTGTTDGITASTNDVGIITLPGKNGHVAIAVFLRASNGDQATREKAIAQAARLLYNYWSKPK